MRTYSSPDPPLTRALSDKKEATTFALVHREQADPRIHDEGASSMVFSEVAAPNSQPQTQQTKIKSRSHLESELGLLPSAIRSNEGEAALHGVYYDDTSYDYMQHMRDLGPEGCFVEAVSEDPSKASQKGKGKQKLEDALRAATLDDPSLPSGVRLTHTPRPLLDADVLPSQNLKQYTYQSQQDVPDALSGFQPDMDPRLREVLEALDDEAYVDDEEDVFSELAREGEEVTLEDFEVAGLDDDGWATDDTEKAADTSMTDPQPSVGPSSDWLKEYSKFKSRPQAHAGAAAAAGAAAPAPSSSLLTSSTTNPRPKRRKGALTSTTSYSMTSSALCRTEGLSLLDSRFDRMEALYADDEEMDFDDGASAATASSQANAGGAVGLREDFDGIMDDFLGRYSTAGKRGKRVREVGAQSAAEGKRGAGGLEQLEEIVSSVLFRS